VTALANGRKAARNSKAVMGAAGRRVKPVEIFEAHGATISAAEEAALAKAEEISRRLKAGKVR